METAHKFEVGGDVYRLDGGSLIVQLYGIPSPSGEHFMFPLFVSFNEKGKPSATSELPMESLKGHLDRIEIDDSESGEPIFLLIPAKSQELAIQAEHPEELPKSSAIAGGHLAVSSSRSVHPAYKSCSVSSRQLPEFQ